MKASKIIGITLLASSLTTCGAWFYNQARNEKENKLFWDQYTVEKYNELRAAKNRDYDVWAREANIIKDSLTNERTKKLDPRNALKSSCDTIMNGLKKIKK